MTRTQPSQTPSGGVVASYGDNRFANNTSGDGETPTAIPLK